MHQLTAFGTQSLQDALGGQWSHHLADGEVRVVCASLPGSAVCAVTRVEDTVWCVLDLDKARAHRHLLTLVRSWPQLVDQLPTPLPDCVERAHQVADVPAAPAPGSFSLFCFNPGFQGGGGGRRVPDPRRENAWLRSVG